MLNENLMIFADFVEPVCKVELMKVDIDRGQDFRRFTENYLFIPEVRMTPMQPRQMAEPEPESDPEEEIFDKASSVFRDWKPDTNKIIKDCMSCDL